LIKVSILALNDLNTIDLIVIHSYLRSFAALRGRDCFE